MFHQFDELGVIIARNVHSSVIFLDEIYGLAHFFCRESSLDTTEVKLCDETVSYRITMQDGVALQGKRLKCMSHRMTHIECFTDALLCRVFFHNPLFHRNGIAHHSSQLLQVGGLQIETDQLRPHLLIADKTVFQHLGISRTDIGFIQGLQKFRIQDHTLGIIEYAHFVFQPVQVDACLSAYTCVNHREQGSRDIDITDTALESRCSKTA